MAITALTGVAVAVLAWRLAQGPVDLPWLTTRLEAAVNANGGPTRLAIGSVALAWEGFRLGVDRPIDLRVSDIAVTDESGRQRMEIPLAEVSLSLRALLLGRIEPRAIEIDRPRLTLLRAADGTLSLDLGSLRTAPDADDSLLAPEPGAERAPVVALLAELARAPANDRGTPRDALLSQLARLRIIDAQIAVVDQKLGVTWRAPQAAIDLTRGPRGGVEGSADIEVALGDQRARLAATASLAAGATQTHLRVRSTPVAPAALARTVPAWAALAALDAPVNGEADIDLAQDLAVRSARLTVHVGAGEVRIARSSVPLLDAAVVVAGTPDALTLQAAQVSLRGHQGGAPTKLQARGTLQHDPGRLAAALSLELDQVDFADLSRLWPEGTGGGARGWIVQNITAGTARNGHVEVGLEAREDDLSAIELTRASGTLDGTGLKVFWLRPIPPIDNGQAQLRIVDPDTLEITVSAGQQRLRGQPDNAPGLALRSGRMRITGIMQPKQIGAIEAEIAGSVPDAIALLREPRLKLFEKHPLDLRIPAGQAAVKLAVGLPLDADVSMDAISIRAQAHLEGVRLNGVVAGRDLDQGVIDLDANTEGMKLNGRATLAGIPAKLDGMMDFRAGSPTQVLQKITVSGTPDAAQLTAAGADVSGALTGKIGLQATLTERRNGQGELGVTADLGATELTAPALEWHKPADSPASASAKLVLDRDRLSRIENIQLDGRALEMRGSADCTEGKLSLLRIDRLVLGRTAAQGTIRFPVGSSGGPIVGSITGASVDLSDRLGHHAPTRKSAEPKTEPPPGPPWTIDARFDRALMAQNRIFFGLALHAESDGRLVQRLRLDGQTSTQSSFRLEITPEQNARRLTASAGDAGELLRGLDIVHTMENGRLTVQARFDDSKPGRPLSGSADIADFRIRNAPALAKLLQAMTLYGLVEVVRGPGLGFSQLVAPFRLAGDEVELFDARAFSPSLGLTLKGRVDLNAEQIDMQGTIVPAYFFNSLLGNIPLVGKLFSPERGGGLFAASYTLRGPLEDPEVFINPLTALTPGILRGLFGIF